MNKFGVGNRVDTGNIVDIEKVYLATILNQGNNKPSKTTYL